MEFLSSFLPIIIYILLIVFLIVGIVLGIKSITTLTKVEKMVDDVNEKVKSLNFFFNIIDFASDKIAGLTDTVVGAISSIFTKKFFKRKNKETERNDEDE